MQLFESYKADSEILKMVDKSTESLQLIKELSNVKKLCFSHEQNITSLQNQHTVKLK